MAFGWGRRTAAAVAVGMAVTGAACEGGVVEPGVAADSEGDDPPHSDSDDDDDDDGNGADDEAGAVPPVECSESGVDPACDDPARPFCSDGLCVDCTQAAPQACGELDPDTPVCAADIGTCVECTADDASACPNEAPLCDEEGLACADACDDVSGRWEELDGSAWIELVQGEPLSEDPRCWLESEAIEVSGDAHFGVLDSACLGEPSFNGWSTDEDEIEVMGWADGGYTKFQGYLEAPCTSMRAFITGYGGTIEHVLVRVD